MKTLLLKNKKIILTSLFLFLLAFIVRWFTLSDLLFFGFEQGRDGNVVEQIVKLEKFTLIGPKTDLAGIFHGPWYYYLLTIPYGLTNGNPLSAAFFIVLVNSLVPVVVFLLARELFNSYKWGFLTAILAVFSHEYIVYSRWLSNISLSPIFVVVCFYFLWLYKTRKKGIYFIISAICAAFSSQMGISQTWIFAFAYLALLILRIIPFPNIKTLLISIVASFIIFSPLIYFDFRHDHITANKVAEYISGEWTEINGKPDYSSLYTAKELVAMGNTQYKGWSDPEAGIDFVAKGGNRKEIKNDKNNNEGKSVFKNINEKFISYSSIMAKIVKRSTYNSDNLLLQIFFIISSIFGVVLFLRHTKNRSVFYFLLVWCFMSLGVLTFSVNLDQIYVGVGLGWIFLFACALKGLWEKNLGKGLVVIIGIFIVFSWFNNLRNLYTNTGGNKTVFFITSQVGMNLKDQRKIIDYVHEDAGESPYRFEAFTLPYLHPEGWHYMNEYYYKNQKPTPGAKTIYIAIEQNVAPFWEKKWIEDYGKTNLIWEKTFGLLRLQKREVIEN